MLKRLKKAIRKLKPVQEYMFAKRFRTNEHYVLAQQKDLAETLKPTSRTEVINYLLEVLDRETHYLEIGVRDPKDNYDSVISKHKLSVDPGIEYEANPVDFKVTSDVFFKQLDKGEILDPSIRFDLIFIDGLHLAEQVDRDIKNSFRYLKEDGFIVLHDCNPPTEWHARVNYNYLNTPAANHWNGTTWKAFLKWRCTKNVFSCCIDSDWGIGVLSTHYNIGESSAPTNPFYEFDELDKNRKLSLNLIDFKELKSRVSNQ